jgi:hypothetical protein
MGSFPNFPNSSKVASAILTSWLHEAIFAEDSGTKAARTLGTKLNCKCHAEGFKQKKGDVQKADMLLFGARSSTKRKLQPGLALASGRLLFHLLFGAAQHLM